MAWSFRKRIKIAPGIHINLSRSGVSTSIGPKGAKLTLGPKGTYLNTSIPGTGIYKRKKISSSSKSTRSSSLSPEGFPTSRSNFKQGTFEPSPVLPQAYSTIFPDMDNSPKKQKKKGCLYTIACVLLVFFLLLLAGGIFSIQNDRPEYRALVAQYDSIMTVKFENDLTSSSAESVKGDKNTTIESSASSAIEDPQLQELTAKIAEKKKGLKQDYLLFSAFLILTSLCVIWLTSWSSSKRKKDSPQTSKKKGPEMDVYTQKMVAKLRLLISSCDEPLKLLVLKNHLGHIIQDDAVNRLKPLVDKWCSKVEKNPSPKNEETFKIYEEQYNAAMNESAELVFDIDSNMSDQEKTTYSSFCDTFQSLKGSDKIWSIISSARNTELKSSAYKTVDRRQTYFKNGFFSYLTSQYQIPVLPASTMGSYYFYPKFVIHGASIEHFDVCPLDDITISYKPTRFIEKDVCPSDSEQVGTTYQYVNKNGEPDRRFAYNPEMPIMLYGDLTINPFGDTFQLSNNYAAKQFENAFRTLRISSGGSNESMGSPVSRKRAFDSIPDGDKSKVDDLSDKDLLEKATIHFVATKNCSLDLFTKIFNIEVTRMTPILERLESIGIIGPADKSGNRKVLVTDIVEALRRLNNFSTKSYSQEIVDEQYFNDILDAAKRLLEFGNKLANDSEFCKLIGESIAGNVNWGGKLLIEPKDKMPVYLWADVIHCYTGLGHEIDLSTNEGLGLLLFNTLMVSPNLAIEYNHLNIIRDTLSKTTESFIRTTAATAHGNNDVFLLEVCLKEYKTQLHNQYVVLLYRFASLVAKADKRVSAKESDWLNKIMALKDPESIQDVFSPASNGERSQDKGKSNDSEETAIQELNSLIGLTSVKSEINTLTNFLKVQKIRVSKGMKVSPVSYHCVFTGNPGTGKTTVARIVSEIYKDLGILKKGHLVETDRSGLVAEYVGQTAVKTNKIIDSALDGVLFVDEAYSLVDGGSSDYGKEAIATLLKRMEDDRDRLVVILAGYSDDMKRFIDSNPGLQSRFNRYIEFPDYSAEELYQIFESSTKKYEYKLTDDATAILKGVLEKAVIGKDKNFGNGRFVRNLFEKVVENQANRISSVADISADSLSSIEACDINSSL